MKRSNISPSVNGENDRIKRRQKLPTSTSTSTSNVRSLNLNDLPDQILLHILSFLPTHKNTVRTTTLISQKWRKLWLSTPSLNFYKLEGGSEDFRLLQRFASFVNQTLIRRPPNTPLLTFDLKLNFDHGVSASQVNSWICYAASHGVENLHLVFDFSFLVPSLTFEFDFRLLRDSRVRVLNLRGCNLSIPPLSLSEKKKNNIMPPPSLFSSLISVKLDGVGTTDEGIVELVASCVNLEVLFFSSVKGCKDIKIRSSKLRVLTLEFFKCEGGSLEIVAPNLKTLIINSFHVGSYALMDVSSLVEANLHLDEFHNWVKVMRFIGHVKHLNTFNWWFELMHSRDIHSGCVLQNLKYVELGTYSMKTSLIGIALLLLRSPNLQTLILDNYSLFNKTAEESISDDFMQPKTFNLPCLKQVKMKSFMGMDGEKRLLTLILKWAVILERIILIPAVGLREAPKPPIVLDCKLNSHRELDYFVSLIPKRRRFISLE